MDADNESIVGRSIEDKSIEDEKIESENTKNERDSRRTRYIILVFIVFIILILILILFLYLIRSPLIFRSGAYSSVTTSTEKTRPAGSSGLSLENSYVFASPLRAKVGGEQIRITVYILNDRGLGISGKTVSLGGGPLQVSPIQPVTDNQGRATFDIASESAPGVYIIEAAVDGATLIQKATVTFD
ncbi:MAG: hypothetical protein UV71_C0002G0003 [Microgenomates group bacterium GW2011_GWC1_43_13]|uniref:Big-1 domain-containing protein n=3 Tax=Candidatus Woeseibacteriota TaxID=1752722 RepID=A0A837I9E8_9BACT|nr:MAG: hypothetical protein UV71_C0002G0003 [Microgenomates group bacterium GW2011_GWC1_43_13]KKT33170.1 MAG: hypothetical protein UW20_C0004G0004 [Candidatus Woesebacteria bacterium GW2011_GWB1_44_11]KKT54491.1 MAG: hypothetical protein UW47_C0005G0039 [Candidatus Woesebacteria bacterium GW2011_GWA1_44_23]OGM76275.1 MAG: hypothetical protein A2208_03160 [Candidatus Woesebacteria bacterium RIFOXYA1_FULL_43_16]OGM81945.1 MAG: hypothetical protein A2394_01250 [Candidatus Woesebacteria bacterium 